MEYRIQSDAQGKTAFLSGRVTSRDFEGFKALTALLEGADSQRLVLDLSAVEFMDSMGLGMVLMLQDKAKNKGVGFSLQGVKGQVKRLFELVKLGNLP
ncbi:MAG: STAS domain-containing protein [Rhodospirillales bacterium]|nr:STAS domain-containing protein [Rhodospirillales bacterium]